MKIEILADADAVAHAAATFIAAEARAAVTERGRFTMAVSGGHTPWQMLRALAGEEAPWEGVHVAQVDERVAPGGDPDRNLTHLRESLLEHAPLRPEQIHAMPVESSDLDAAAKRYAMTLRELASSPPVLDVTDTDVGLTQIYQERRRMTLTYPMLNRSRRILWLVTGSDKVGALERLRNGDPSIPAGRIQRYQALVLADRAAALHVESAKQA
jgi:6-phosphogluconolactonase